MRNKPVRSWIKQWQDDRECIQWLKHDNADALAAKALYHLNRGAKGNIQQDTIYALKTLVLEQFYKAGFCIGVRAEVQELVCFHCQGDGVDPYEGDDYSCERCGGSGIYATHYLYGFSFNIAGQFYIWHQPQKLVTWSVETTTDELGDYEGNARYEFLPDIALTHYIAVLRAYLKLRNVHNIPSLTLREALKTSLRWWYVRRVSYPMAKWFKPIYHGVLWYQEWNRKRHFPDYGDIPF